MKSAANRGPTREANGFKPPDSATAMTPRIGKPTAVVRKPRKPVKDAVAASAPSQGGKIRFPAPKNIAKSVKPMRMRWRTERDDIKRKPEEKTKTNGNCSRGSHAKKPFVRSPVIGRPSPERAKGEVKLNGIRFSRGVRRAA